MSVSAIQAQWSIDTTSATVLPALRGLLIAATSDNVQVLALLACRQFGTTLAMCDETLQKIQMTVVPSPKPASIAFLRATVGYSANDCATQLAESLEGLRFLALAAALISTQTKFAGARAIDMMLRRSASDGLLPTQRNLRDLLASLEARSARCGFADSVVGWQILLRKEAFPHKEPPEHPLWRHNISWKEHILHTVPTPDMVDRLVNMFGQLGRVGEHTISGATIKTVAAVPWIVAFTKWCLGKPPSIVMSDGREILRQPQSLVTVIVAVDTTSIKQGFNITIHSSLDGLNQLLVVPDATSPRLNAMVSIEKYGEFLLAKLGFLNGIPAALQEALEYGIPIVLEALHCSDLDALWGRKRRSLSRSRSPSSSFSTSTSSSFSSLDTAGFRLRTATSAADCHLEPLPGLRAVTDAYNALLRPESPPQFTLLADNMLFDDLPLVSRILKKMKRDNDRREKWHKEMMEARGRREKKEMERKAKEERERKRNERKEKEERKDGEEEEGEAEEEEDREDEEEEAGEGEEDEEEVGNGDSDPVWTLSTTSNYYGSVTCIIAHVLALSLFDSIEPLLLKLPAGKLVGSKFERFIQHLLRGMTKGSAEHSYLDIIAFAQGVIGHDVGQEEDDNSTFVTSAKGQVVYPALLDTLTLEKQGVLRLLCYQGALAFEGDTYPVVVGDKQAYLKGMMTESAYQRYIGTKTWKSFPLHLTPGFSCFWDVSTRDDGKLNAMLQVRSTATGEPTWPQLDPAVLSGYLEHTLLLESCPHDSRAPVDSADAQFSVVEFLDHYQVDDLKKPLHSYTAKGTRKPLHIYVINTGGAEDVRCFVRGYMCRREHSRRPVVVRRAACINCCLALCREAKIDNLIF